MTINAGKGPASPWSRILRRLDHGLYALDLDWRGSDPPAQKGREHRRPDPDVPNRGAELARNFEDYVRKYDASAPFRRAGQLDFHQSTIRLRRQAGTVRHAVEDPRFIEALRRTLYAWGIGKRGTTLASVERLRHTLAEHRPRLEELEHLALENLTAGEVSAVTDRVFGLIGSLDIVSADAKIVAGTKTLHHLLPDLVPPMDRAWTGAFFKWSTIDVQYRQERTFGKAFVALADVARLTQPKQFVGIGWRTSSTKVLDNAVIGYCLAHRLGGARDAGMP
jgi:hypothetical protein